MSNFYTPGKYLACRPLKREGITHEIRGGIAIMDHKSKTLVTEVLFDAMINNEWILKGSKVAVTGDSEAKPWNSLIMSHEGIEFVNLPYEEILLLAAPEENKK